MNLKLLQSHWFLLFIYFGISSMVLFANNGHHHDTTVPFILLVLPTLLLFLRSSVKQSYLAITVLLIFMLLHIMPFVPMMQMHHQSQSLSQHPCCMPQIATVIVVFIVSPFVSLLYKKRDVLPMVHLNPAFVLLSTRAPPRSF